jgi:nitrite reductase/ring-hydroxylating ferredoxin subunit
MKKYILLVVIVSFICGCDNDNYSYKNKYLPNYNFSIDINTDLPLYSQLQFPSNPVRVTQAGIGINGVIVMNTGGSFTAFEASCPNQELGSCSVLTINGINVICPCDDVQYSLFTGQANTKVEYPLKPYKVQQIASNIIRVYN